MKSRSIWLSLVLATTLGGAAMIGASGCSAPDPGAVNSTTRRSVSQTPAPSGTGDTGGSGTDPGGTGTTPTHDGGTTDGGAEGGGTTPPDAFTGAGAYQVKNGTSTLQAQHNNANAPDGNTQNPFGQNCFDCHTAAGPGTAFAVGGTITTTVGGKTPAASIQVRFRAPDGKTYATYTDAQGNFFALATAFTLANDTLVGARDGQSTALMSAHLANAGQGSCNQGNTCHGGTAKSISVN